MGKLIQCSSKLAKEPYHFPLTKTNVYSLEEVCYYIRHNIYMMQEEIFDRDFAHWVNRELGLGETADKLEKLISEHHNLKDIVVTICCSCDYYEEDEIRELIQIMDDLEKNEIDLSAAQKFYNDAVIVFNKLILAFPSNIIGFFKGYKKKDFYNNEKREMFQILNDRQKDVYEFN